MKKINKILIGVIGGLTLFVNKGQITKAAINNVQRYGVVVPTINTQIYKDTSLNVVRSTPTPTLSSKPTTTPTPTLSSKPTATPTPTLSSKPTATPTPKPTAKPTAKPTPKPTPKTTSKSTAKASQGVEGIFKNIQASVSNFFSSFFNK